MHMFEGCGNIDAEAVLAHVSKFYARAGLDALAVGVFAFPHFSDQIGNIHEPVRRIAPGENKMGIPACGIQKGFEMVAADEAIIQGVDCFIQHQHPDPAAGSPGEKIPGHRLMQGPLRLVAEKTGPTCAVVIAQQGGQQFLLPCHIAPFHKLAKSHAKTMPQGAERLPHTGAGFALAITCIDKYQFQTPAICL